MAFKSVKTQMISFLSTFGELCAGMSISAPTLLLIIMFLFPSFSSFTPGLEVVFGPWQKPVLYTITAVWIYYLLVGVARVFFPIRPEADSLGVAQYATARMVKSKRLSEEKIMRYAIHEAAHLVTFALYEKFPDILSVSIKPFGGDPLGNVHFQYNSLPDNRKYYEDLMFTYLAGSCAEKVFFNENKFGSEKDNQDWESVAKRYLSSFDHNYHWFAQPQNEAEAKVNATSLKDFQKVSRANVQEFIKLNKNLIRSIAQDLAESETNEILTGMSWEYLGKVVVS
jgi:hypothetical protein